MQLGNLYQRKHDLKKSIDALQHAQELRPNDWKASASLATVQQEAGLMPEAKRNYERAMKLGADDPDLFNNLAYLDAQSKSDLDAALALAQKALARSPKNPGYADTLGFVYLQQKQIASAYQVFHSLSDRYPKEGIYRYHLAFALCAKGDNDAAKRELQSALTLEPSLAAEPDAKEWMQKIRYNER